MFKLTDCNVVQITLSSVNSLNTTVLVLVTDTGRSLAISTVGKGCYEKSDYDYLFRILDDKDNSWEDVVEYLTTDAKIHNYSVTEESKNDQLKS